MTGANAIELDYAALEAEAISILSAERVWVLATSSAEGPTARSMSIVNDGLEVWFQTGLGSRKYEQLTAQPRVALCRGNLQYEGIARPRGKAGDPGNEWFLSEYRLAHPGSFAAYGSLPEEVVVRVTPLRATLWKYLDGRPFKDVLDAEARRAWRVPQASAR